MNSNTPNETELLKSSLAGNTTAFETIVSRYQSIVCAITFSATGSIDKSEELAQETFVKAWKDLAKLREPAKFKKWLYAIARTTVKQHYRSQQRDPIKGASPIDAANSVPSGNPDPIETVISKEHQAIVAAAIKHIPEDYRQPLILFYRHNRSAKEVAAALDISEEAARQRLHRARKMLKEKIASIVETTIEDSAPTKAFTAIVMASITALALNTSAAAVTASTAPTSVATSTVGSLLSTITAKAITAAAVAAIAITSAVIYNNTTENDNDIAMADITQSQPQFQPEQKVEMPYAAQAIVPTIASSQSDNLAKQPIAQQTKAAIASEKQVGTIDVGPETDITKKQETKISYKGIVIDEQGNPIENVRVWSCLQTTSLRFNGVESETTTDEKGTYILGPIVECTEENYLQRNLIFEHPDYSIGWVIAVDLAKIEKQTDPVIRTTLHSPSAIAGRVTDTQGNPIPDATIEVSLRYIDGKGYRYFYMKKFTGMTQLSDAYGQFTFTHLPEGAMVSVEVTHKDYALYSTALAYPDNDEYLISADDKDIQITMEPGGSIKGRFIYEDGRPYKDKDILLYIVAPSNNLMILEQTDENGTFQTCALPEGTYVVKPLSTSIAKNNFFCRTLTDVNVSLETGATEIDMIVQKPLPVTVTIYDSETGQPLEKIVVSAILNYIYELNGSVAEASDRTDEKGKCTLMLAPDKYQIVARGYKDNEFHDFTQELIVTADSENLAVELDITPPDMVWGTLTDSQGNPVQGAVSIGSHNCDTDESGNFELSLDWARDDKKHIGFARDKSKALSTAFLWNMKDDIYELQLTLDKPASITGQIIDPDGNPIKNANLSLQIIMGDGTTTGFGEHQWSQQVKPDGKFIIYNIPTGLDYQVFAERPGFQGLYEVVNIEPQQKIDIGNLTLKPTGNYDLEGDIDWTGQLNGTIVDEFNRPIPGLMVNVDIGTLDFIEGKTDIKGRFKLKNLPKGRKVSFSTFVLAGYGSRHVDKIIDGTELEIQLFPQGWELLDKPAPELHVEKWLNIDKDITLEDYKGYVTLLLIDVKLPSISDDIKFINKMLGKYYDKGFEVIAIHQRKPIGPKVEYTVEYIMDYIKGFDIDFPVGLDAKGRSSTGKGATYRLYQGQLSPAFYLIDKKGILRISPKRDELEDWIKLLLDE